MNYKKPKNWNSLRTTTRAAAAVVVRPMTRPRRFLSPLLKYSSKVEMVALIFGIIAGISARIKIRQTRRGQGGIGGPKKERDDDVTQQNDFPQVQVESPLPPPQDSLYLTTRVSSSGRHRGASQQQQQPRVSGLGEEDEGGSRINLP